MEILGIVFMLLGVTMFVFINMKRFINQKNAAEKFKKEIQNNPSLEDAQKKNEAIISNLEKFLKSSRFYEMTGRRGDEKIYRYILNSGKLYRFDGFLSPNNMKVGIDEDFLYFKGMSYKRETDIKEFSEKFSTQTFQTM